MSRQSEEASRYPDEFVLTSAAQRVGVRRHRVTIGCPRSKLTSQVARRARNATVGAVESPRKFPHMKTEAKTAPCAEMMGTLEFAKARRALLIPTQFQNLRAFSGRKMTH